MVAAQAGEQWRVGFVIEATTGERPGRDFLRGLAAKPAAEIMAVLIAVRDAPPYRFAGGGKWEAMHDTMAGFYEVRARSGQSLHRLFCLLDRTLDTPTLVVVSGASKPNRTPMPEAVYAEARRLRTQYEERRDRGRVTDVLEV